MYDFLFNLLTAIITIIIMYTYLFDGDMKFYRLGLLCTAIQSVSGGFDNFT